MKFNDLDIENWKDIDVNVDSLWLIGGRDKKGKHSNKYHGNFIPQIPYQLMKRYTKREDIVLDVFLGSGTTLFECENLNRNFIGFDINDDIISFVNDKMKDSSEINFDIHNCDVANTNEFSNKMKKSLTKLHSDKVQFLIMHPPYMDIVKRVKNLYNNLEAVELRKMQSGILEVDHRFPQVRWNSDEDNNDNLTDEELKNKFILLTRQHNLWKARICSKCVAYRNRGSFPGISFWYFGSKEWDSNIEESNFEGCIGCFWYNPFEWRKELQNVIDS